MSKNVTRVGVVGAAGRMGQRLIQMIEQTEGLTLGGVLEHKRPIELPAGSDAITTSDVSAFVQASDIVIDFSAPAALDRVLSTCVDKQVAYLVASTALTAAQQKLIDAAATTLPVLVAANLSVGIAVLSQVVKEAVKRLADFDVEIVEAHHRHKRDAPSGTALYLFEQARAARDTLRAEPGRAGHETTRNASEVGLHAIRGGDVAGEHQVLLLGDSERLELTHRSHDGFVFARGAIRAATWLLVQKPGLYDMHDVLGSR